jgi:nucleotide-binding universal stress UspA family protein
MFDNILIGVDGRAGGRDAIALAKRLAPPSASFTLTHVECGPISWWEHQVGEERVFDRSASMLAAERERAAIRAAIVCVNSTEPAQGLHDLAEERAVDLIVVGSSRHALLGRVLLGDDTRASVDRAPCAIAIAPHGYAERPAPLVDIGVGYDGSRESEYALAPARELASRSGARIRALHEPSKELCRLSSELDLLIVRNRADGSLGHPIHGSVSRYLVGHVACPLLVLARDVAHGSAAARAA